VPVALDLADEFERTPRGAVPDLEAAFAANGAADDPAVRVVRDDLVGAIEEALTRGFRSGYLISALFALLALGPVIAGARAAGGGVGLRAPPSALAPLAALLVAGGVVVGAAVAAGGPDLGRSTVADPCVERVREDGEGLDATVQGIVLDGLAGAACELDVSREDLVLSFGTGVGTRPIPWDPATVEVAVRAGVERAIDDAEDRGSLNGVVADVMRAIVRRAPVEELIEGGGAVRDLAGRVDDIDFDPGALVDRLRGLVP
jgi:hypothetical protein